MVAAPHSNSIKEQEYETHPEQLLVSSHSDPLGIDLGLDTGKYGGKDSLSHMRETDVSWVTLPLIVQADQEYVQGLGFEAK